MWKLILNFIGGPIVKGILDGYKARLASINTRDRLAVDIALKEVDAKIARTNARKEMNITSMSHPVWWFAWGLFVIPVGLYHASIYMLSILSIGPDVYAVLQVPPEQEKLGRTIVEYIFLAQGGAGVTGAVLNRFGKR